MLIDTETGPDLDFHKLPFLFIIKVDQDKFYVNRNVTVIVVIQKLIGLDNHFALVY